MESSSDLISPKQAARAIGVSESSLKRWCDQGLIHAVRTAGGHRKLRVSDVLRFVREQNHPLVSPELLELPAASVHAEIGLSRGRQLLVEALLAGNDALAWQIVFDLYRAKHSLGLIFDAVVAGAFHDIGERWVCQTADLYQERRACEIAIRILFDIRRILPAPAMGLRAIGGTIEGDLYAIPSAMVELVLRESGWNACTLGASLPFASLIRAVEETRPRLFWLSVSHIPEGLDFVAGFASLSQICVRAKAALVVGGRAITDDLRLKMSCFSFCDTMQHLEAFARTVSETLPEVDQGGTPARLMVE